jgi:Gram-negative bacterial TonB protein C-terminal
LRTAHANGTLPGIIQGIWPSPGLGLKLSNSGDRLQLSWNQGAPAVRDASDAILEISDGADHRQVRLTSREVANGSVLYRPNTEDVAFRLEVHGREGETLSETMRVLGDLKPATLDVSRPQAPSDDTATRKPSSSRPGITGSQLQLDGNTPIDPSRLVAVRPRRERQATAGSRPVPSAAPGGANMSAPAVSPSASAAQGPVSPPNPAMQGADSAQPGGALADAVLPNLSPSNPNLSKEPNSRTNTVAQNAPPPSALPAREIPLVSPASQTARPDTNAGRSPDVIKKPEQSKQALAGSGRTTDNTVGSAPAQLPPGQINPSTPRNVPAYQPPRPVKQILPNLKALPAGMADATGDVKVLLKVNESGHVTDAQVVEDNKKVSSLVKAASIIAAKQWVFEPATLRGHNIASEHTILFQFHH